MQKILNEINTCSPVRHAFRSICPSPKSQHSNSESFKAFPRENPIDDFFTNIFLPASPYFSDWLTAQTLPFSPTSIFHKKFLLQCVKIFAKIPHSHTSYTCRRVQSMKLPALFSVSNFSFSLSLAAFLPAVNLHASKIFLLQCSFFSKNFTLIAKGLSGINFSSPLQPMRAKYLSIFMLSIYKRPAQCKSATPREIFWLTHFRSENNAGAKV